MGMRLTYEVDWKDAESMMDAIENKLADPWRILKHMGAWARTEMKANLDKETASAGPWPQLAPSTVKQRTALGYGGDHPMLYRTGELRRSITMDLIGGDTVEVGPTLEIIAAAQDLGTDRIPAREFAYIDDNRFVDELDIIGLYVTDDEMADLPAVAGDEGGD